LVKVEPLPADELAPDARERLIRYLNDAAAVEREQSGLLQTLADATTESDLRSAYERHRQATEGHRDAVERRVRELGGKPDAGRGLLGRLVTRVWDALQKPPDAAPDPVENLLQAISAAEFEAGMYLVVHALARVVGDAQTADLAAAHHRQERDFADGLRARLTPAAVRAASANR
jgi:ferritin-like metal-binding protein YciE